MGRCVVASSIPHPHGRVKITCGWRQSWTAYVTYKGQMQAAQMILNLYLHLPALKRYLREILSVTPKKYRKKHVNTVSMNTLYLFYDAIMQVYNASKLLI